MSALQLIGLSYVVVGLVLWMPVVFATMDIDEWVRDDGWFKPFAIFASVVMLWPLWLDTRAQRWAFGLLFLALCAWSVSVPRWPW